MRYRVMSSIRKRGTRPERALIAAARTVFQGRRIICHASNLRGCPDVYVPSLRLVLFCDGCLFHGCPRHCRIPRRNARYWTGKIRRNATRDSAIRQSLRRRGLSVWRVWEHDCVDGRLVTRLRAIEGKLDAEAARSPSRSAHRLRGAEIVRSSDADPGLYALVAESSQPAPARTRSQRRRPNPPAVSGRQETR